MNDFPEVTLQMLADADINPFAVQLVAESITRKPDFINWKNPIKFTFNGIKFTLEKA